MHGNLVPTAPIRNVVTEDGVRISYWQIGDGPPLIIMPTLMTSVSADWRTLRGRMYDFLARRRSVVRFDSRGQGASERQPERLGLDGCVADVKAVLEDLGIDRTSILAPGLGAVPSAAFARRYPERVERLILWTPFTCAQDYFGRAIRDLLPLAHSNWQLFTMALCHVQARWLDSESAIRNAETFQQAITQDYFLRQLEQASEFDATPMLGGIRAPTLVLCRQGAGAPEVRAARETASAIPGAVLSLLPENNLAIWDQQLTALDTISQFLLPDQSALSGGRLRLSHDGLSRREKEVLQCLAAGMTNKEIAGELGISVYTIARHVANTYQKIGARTRAEATLVAHGFQPSRFTPAEVTNDTRLGEHGIAAHS